MAGEKLIDHLKKWLEPDKLTQMGHEWASGQEAEVAAATLRLFHLLPLQAAKFLESGVRPWSLLPPCARGSEKPACRILGLGEVVLRAS